MRPKQRPNTRLARCWLTSRLGSTCCSSRRSNLAELRWHARFCAETAVDLETGMLVLHLLAAIGGAEPAPAARVLRELIGSYDASLAEPLRRWEMEQAANR
jgi:hypothetical protein